MQCDNSTSFMYMVSLQILFYTLDFKWNKQHKDIEMTADSSQSYSDVYMTNLPVESCAEAMASQNLLGKGTCRPLKEANAGQRLTTGGKTTGAMQETRLPIVVTSLKVAFHSAKCIIVKKQNKTKKTTINRCPSMEHWCKDFTDLQSMTMTTSRSNSPRQCHSRWAGFLLDLVLGKLK